MKRFVILVFVAAFLTIIATSIISYGGVTEFVETLAPPAYGYLQLGNVAPSVEAIYIDTVEATDTYTNCPVNPSDDTYTQSTITLKIRDANGDCHTAVNSYVYICPEDQTPPCDTTKSDRSVELTSANLDAHYDETGASNPNGAYCNFSYTGASIQFAYFETIGDWGIYANVTDDNWVTGGTDLEKRLEYNKLVAFQYPYPYSDGTISMGELLMGQWNNGTTTGDAGKNTGNIIQDLYWEATRFETGAAVDWIDITGNNYIIDDDQISPDDTGNLAEAYIPSSGNVQFEPSSGLQVCGQFECSSPLDAKITTYWHIDIPPAKTPGTYNNTITITHAEHL